MGCCIEVTEYAAGDTLSNSFRAYFGVKSGAVVYLRCVAASPTSLGNGCGFEMEIRIDPGASLYSIRATSHQDGAR